MKRGDDNELKRKLRLEKVVAGKQLRLAVERARLEKLVDTAQLMLAPIKSVVNVGVVLSLKPIPKSWQLCLSFKLNVHRHP